MTPPIPRGFLFYTKYAVENKVHYLVFLVQTVPRKIFGNRRMTVLPPQALDDTAKTSFAAHVTCTILKYYTLA